MKIRLRFILFIPLFFLSCYIFDYSGNSRIAIRLGSFPAGVSKVHVAVFDGYPSTNNLLLTNIIDPGGSINLEIPGGNNRYFVFVGENTKGLGQYYGITGPYNINTDSVTTVVVNMNLFNVTFTKKMKNVMVAIIMVGIKCSQVPGATQYLIYGGDYPIDPDINPYDDTLLYTGLSNYYSTSEERNYRARVYFEIFNLYSDYSDATHTDNMPQYF